MRALLKYADFWNRPKAAFVVGFLSVYIVWFVPSLFWGWNGWTSFAYTFGDPIVLSLFNACAFYLLSKRKQKIPLWSILIVIPGGLFIVFFEDEASAARQIGQVGWNINTYHGIFVFFQFSFVLFMTAVHPFLRSTFYTPRFWVFTLFALITCFLAFVFGPDDNINRFPLWKKAIPIGLLWTTFTVFMIDIRTDFLEKTRVRISTYAFNRKAAK